MCRLEFYTFYLCAKFDDSSFSRFRDIVGVPKFKVGHCDLNYAPINGHLSSVCWDLT